MIYEKITKLNLKQSVRLKVLVLQSKKCYFGANFSV